MLGKFCGDAAVENDEALGSSASAEVVDSEEQEKCLPTLVRMARSSCVPLEHDLLAPIRETLLALRKRHGGALQMR